MQCPHNPSTHLYVCWQNCWHAIIHANKVQNQTVTPNTNYHFKSTPQGGRGATSVFWSAASIYKGRAGEHGTWMSNKFLDSFVWQHGSMYHVKASRPPECYLLTTSVRCTSKTNEPRLLTAAASSPSSKPICTLQLLYTGNISMCLLCAKEFVISV